MLGWRNDLSGNLVSERRPYRRTHARSATRRPCRANWYAAPRLDVRDVHDRQVLEALARVSVSRNGCRMRVLPLPTRWRTSRHLAHDGRAFAANHQPLDRATDGQITDRARAGPATALDNPFVRKTGMVQPLPHPQAPAQRMLASPIRVDGRRLPARVCSALVPTLCIADGRRLHAADIQLLHAQGVV